MIERAYRSNLTAIEKTDPVKARRVRRWIRNLEKAKLNNGFQDFTESELARMEPDQFPVKKKISKEKLTLGYVMQNPYRIVSYEELAGFLGSKPEKDPAKVRHNILVMAWRIRNKLKGENSADHLFTIADRGFIFIPQ